MSMMMMDDDDDEGVGGWAESVNVTIVRRGAARTIVTNVGSVGACAGEAALQHAQPGRLAKATVHSVLRGAVGKRKPIGSSSRLYVHQPARSLISGCMSCFPWVSVSQSRAGTTDMRSKLLCSSRIAF